MMPAIRWFLLLLLPLLVMRIASNGVCFGADIPEKVQEELDRGKKRFDSEFKEANETLLGSFDKKMKITRAVPKLSAEEKQHSISTIEAEKSVFETTGHVPFSSPMRTETIEYLNKVQKAEMALAKIYDRAIEAQTKQKNDELARELVADKKMALEPKIVAKWTTTKIGTVSLLSNGKVAGFEGTVSWTLDQREFVTKWKNKDAPGDFWINTCVISDDGATFEAKNQVGFKYSGTRLIAE